MTFAVNSTSVETDAIERTIRVLQRAKVSKFIQFAGVFNCRVIAGTDSYSQHAWGNAVDLFPHDVPGFTSLEELAHIANGVVYQATHKTTANRGRKIPVSQVIDHNNRRIWTVSDGWHTYTGATGAHVHVSGLPLRSGTPPCAKG